ncbi:uncharacterized protein IWZ02DRAFT_503583 [Phyllosticta citriasiana]|uniref:uncharacterized protein n=1 Tax=Phyllosticta citriasiana TaxID=595635 RepID=UPI0030FDDD24
MPIRPARPSSVAMADSQRYLKPSLTPSPRYSSTNADVRPEGPLLEDPDQEQELKVPTCESARNDLEKPKHMSDSTLDSVLATPNDFSKEFSKPTSALSHWIDNAAWPPWSPRSRTASGAAAEADADPNDELSEPPGSATRVRRRLFRPSDASSQPTMTSPDAQSQPPKRPAAPRRSHSSQSQPQSHSPNDPAHHRDAPHHRSAHKAQRHVVGHGRLGPRNPSYGKNLNKQAVQQNHHHHRTLSTGSTSTRPRPTTPPPPSLEAQCLGRRSLAQHVARPIAQKPLKRHLPRQAGKATHRQHRSSDLEPLTKRGEWERERGHRRRSSSSSQGRAARARPRWTTPACASIWASTTDGDDDNAWTEESASQSPATTRSTTRQNSKQQQQQQQQQQQESNSDPPSPRNTSRTQRPEQRVTYSSNQINGVNSYHQPKPADADMITSRILQRSASNRLQPQVSDVSATVVSHSHDARSLSHSTGSTMIDTPGNKEAVSRFIDGDGSSGTPRDTQTSNRNKKAGDLLSHAHSSHHHRGSSSAALSAPNGAGGSSGGGHTHPHHRHSSSQLVVVGGVTPSGDVIMDRELARRFDEAAAEYRVVRRFRNPVADAIARLAESPDSPRWRSQSASVATAHVQRQRNGECGGRRVSEHQCTGNVGSPLSKASSSLALNTQYRPSTQGGTDREVRTNGLRSSSAATLVSPSSMTPGGAGGSDTQMQL